MDKVAYNRYGKGIQQELPLLMGDVPGIGSIAILSAGQPPNEFIFHLEDYFVLGKDGRCNVRYFPTIYQNYANLFDAVKAIYPQEMLPSDSKLYAIANGTVWEGKTKKAKHFEELGDFVDYIQTVERGGAAVISFGRRDFSAFTTAVESSGNELWGISENVSNRILYRIHIHGTPSKPAPPKYKRKGKVKQLPQPDK